MADSCAFVQHNTTGGLEFLDVLLYEAGGFDDFDSLVQDDLGVVTVGWWVNCWQDCEVYSERFIGQLTGLVDFLSEIVRGRLGQAGELGFY